MLSVHSEQPHKTGFPTVHALVLLEGTMNLTGETQPLVEQLMMVKRMQVGGPELLLCLQGGWAFGGRREDSSGPSERNSVSLVHGGKWIPVLHGSVISPDVPGPHVRVGKYLCFVVSGPAWSPGACRR